MAKKQFKTESKRILDLMINSIYTHQEIFLREIISNASDAIDRLCYLSLTDEDVKLGRDDFRIKLYVSEDERVISVSDNGIGMDKTGLEDNLGVIAKSGTRSFKNELDKQTTISDVDIIGQFGVGFYSSFMVADKVTVISRAYGSDTGYKWESTGADGYTIEECEKADVGTDVILYIKEDVEIDEYTRFLNDISIGQLVKKYSDYIRWPIIMDGTVEVEKETGEVDADGKPVTETVIETGYDILNSMVPIWQRDKSEVTKEETDEFYRDLALDFQAPLSTIRVNAEGLTSYRAMVFIPEKMPVNFFSTEFEAGLQLYCNGVMIMEKCSDVVPECFRFVRGVADSPDFSLNISREMLQHTRQLTVIRNNLEKKIKNELLRLMDDESDEYDKFYASFGNQLKYAAIGKQGEKLEFLTDLFMFYSSQEKELVPLREYRKKMPEDQKFIYYVCADSITRAANLPQAEQVRDKGFEVLYMLDSMDDFLTRRMAEYDGIKLCNISTDDLGLESDDEKAETDKQQEEHKELLDFVKESLGDGVVSVRFSHKLKTHPVYLATDGDVSIEMEKYFSAIKSPDAPIVKAQRVLELNPNHHAFEALKNAFENDKEHAENLSRILLAQGKLIAGLTLDDAAEYTELICKLF